jgi:hypothetical protein
MLVGAKDIIVDFVFSKNRLLDSPNCQKTNTCFSLQYKATAVNSMIVSSMEAIKANSTAYRLKIQFVPLENYTICFYTPNISALNLEYYVLLNDPSMEHII